MLYIMPNKLYIVTTKFACARLEVDERGIIVKVAQIWRSFYGKPLERFVKYIDLYKGTVKEIPNEEV